MNASHLAVLTVEPSSSAKYSCEVSADAPSFHTRIVSGDMEVVGESSYDMIYFKYV